MNKRIMLLLAVLMCSGCAKQPPEQEAARHSDAPAPQAVLPDLIRHATTRPWPGRNYPELPPLSNEVISGTMEEINSKPSIREAYKKLHAAEQRNIVWFEGISELEKNNAIWSLLSCLCHPSESVQIHAIRALAGLKDERSLPFLLKYASAMAVHESGSENATIHGVIHSEIAKTLSAITGLTLQMKRGQDPEGLKSAIEATTIWLMERKNTNLNTKTR